MLLAVSKVNNVLKSVYLGGGGGGGGGGHTAATKRSINDNIGTSQVARLCSLCKYVCLDRYVKFIHSFLKNKAYHST